MPVIVVANPKGGVGKSTLATNVAGWWASLGHSVMLGDLDRQHSARNWLALRPPELAEIRGWELTVGERVKAPKGTTHVVLDTPAGLHGKRLEMALRLADRLLVPLQPSPFDLGATLNFVHTLRTHSRGAELPLALVGMRVKPNTHATEHLHETLQAAGLGLVAELRDTQNYVHLAARGLSLWDVAPGRVERDRLQWQPLTNWIST